MSVVSAQHAHTPTGPSEHGSPQAQEAVASAPARDPNATHGASAKSGSSHVNRQHADHGKKHHEDPTRRDLPSGESDANVLVRERIQTAWAKFSGTTRPLLP